MKSLIAKPYEAGPLAAGTATALVRPITNLPAGIDDILPADPSGFWCFRGSEPVVCIYPAFEVGQQFAVRETFGRRYVNGVYGEVVYRTVEPDVQVNGWRPPQQMPLHLVRTRLEVTGVSVVRLQQLKLADLVVLGFREPDRDLPFSSWQDTIDEFKETHDATYGKGAYERNEWMWLIRVRKV